MHRKILLTAENRRLFWGGQKSRKIDDVFYGWRLYRIFGPLTFVEKLTTCINVDILVTSSMYD